MGKQTGRSLAVLLACAAVALALPGVAFAHVEVEARPAVAGAENAVLTFSAEAESSTAGIASVRIVLPDGIAPADVTLDKAPSGWRLTPTRDGYTVAGQALATGRQAVHSIRVARLPDATRLVFKALVTYSDGDVDRWIEEPSNANPSPDNPAVLLTLSPPPRPAATPSPTSAASTPAGATTTAIATTAATPEPGYGWLWWLLGGLVVVAGAAVTFFARRPRSGADFG